MFIFKRDDGGVSVKTGSNHAGILIVQDNDAPEVCSHMLMVMVPCQEEDIQTTLQIKLTKNKISYIE